MRALLFDVFGTCVDWRTSMMREAERFGLPPQLAQAWRDEYQPQMETVRSGQRPWVNLDVLHEIGLKRVLKNLNLTVSKADRAELVKGWHRLDPWPDVVAGLTRLKETYIIAPCSNGHIAQSVNLAKFAKLPWDAILGAEIAHAYKPDPRVYRESVYALGLEPDEVCMVAAHRDDLRAAAKVGLQTAFVERFGEDPGPAFRADFVAHDFEELLR
jgi:2-haloacid dehalogenase